MHIEILDRYLNIVTMKHEPLNIVLYGELEKQEFLYDIIARMVQYLPTFTNIMNTLQYFTLFHKTISRNIM